MTALPNNDRTVRLAPSAGATSLAYDFWIARAEDLAVWRVRAGTATLLTLTTDYSVSGAGADAGGTVTLAAAALAGDAYVLAGAWQIQQVLDLVTAGDFRAEDVDHQHRLILSALMEIRRDLGRALASPLHGISTDPYDAATRPINGLSYIELDEAVVAAAPANKLRLYAKDVDGATRLYARTSTLEIDLSEAAASAAAAVDAADRAEAAAAMINLPAVTGQGGKYLRVRVDESGYEHGLAASLIDSVNGETGTVVIDATDVDIADLVPSRYTPAGASVEGHLEGVDDALADLDGAVTAIVRGTRPNLVINGDFQINQRVFAGGALAAGAYGFDRWKGATGGANATLSGFVLTLASGELEQVIEPALWGVSSFALMTVTASAEDPSQDLTVTFGSQSGTIPAGSGRQSVTLTLGAGDTGNRSLKIKRATAGSVTFGRVKMEIGGAATDWQARPSATEFVLASRYFRRLAGLYHVSFTSHTTNAYYFAHSALPAPMRAIATTSREFTQSGNLFQGSLDSAVVLMPDAGTMTFEVRGATAGVLTYASFTNVRLDAEL